MIRNASNYLSQEVFMSSFFFFYPVEEYYEHTDDKDM
jgi:hypothetical protein